MDGYKTLILSDARTTHECFVCGDTIELTAQVCSRFCMRAMEQMMVLDSLDNLEAQVETPTNSSSTSNSDYAPPSPHKIVPEQRTAPVLIEVDSCLSYSVDTPRPYTLD